MTFRSLILKDPTNCATMPPVCCHTSVFLDDRYLTYYRVHLISIIIFGGMEKYSTLQKERSYRSFEKLVVLEFLDLQKFYYHLSPLFKSMSQKQSASKAVPCKRLAEIEKQLYWNSFNFPEFGYKHSHVDSFETSIYDDFHELASNEEIQPESGNQQEDTDKEQGGLAMKMSANKEQ